MDDLVNFGMGGAVIVTVLVFVKFIGEQGKAEREERRNLADTYVKAQAHFSDQIGIALKDQSATFCKMTETFHALTDTIHSRDGQFRIDQIAIRDEQKAQGAKIDRILGEVDPHATKRD